MFETKIRTNYNNNGNIGHALVYANKSDGATIIDFLYAVDKDGGWHFMYENGTCLSDSEKAELENWFVTCG